MNDSSSSWDLPPARAFVLRWGRRLAKGVVLLLSVALLLEIAARLWLPERSSRYLLEGESDGSPAWIENQFFPYRFVSARTAKPPPPVVALKTRPADGLRVCLLGGSTALGAPDPSFGLGRQLELLLQHRYPGHSIEVLPMALDDSNSHVLREVARDLDRLAPDAVIVLAGNEEVAGPYGPASGLGRFHHSSRIARIMAVFSRTGLSRLFIAAGNRLFPARADLDAWRSQEPLSPKGRMAPGDPHLKTAYRSFRKNLSAILRTASRASPAVIVCTVPVNLRDCAPFSTSYLEDETAAQEVREILRAAAAAEAVSNRAETLRLYANALRRDPTHAEALFRAGRLALQDRHTAEAAALFSRARDADALRLRADSSINSIIRECAAEASASLLDAEALFAIRSPQGIPGREWFLDHIHFTFEGNHLLASALLDRLEFLRAFAPEPAGDIPDPQTLADELLYHPWGRAAQLDSILRQMLRPPFRWQLDNAETLARLKEEKSAWDARVAAMSPENTRAIFARRQANRPRDAWLAARAAGLLLDAGDPVRAEAAALAAHRQWPHRYDIRALLSLIHALQGQTTEDGIAFLRGGGDPGYYDIPLAIDIGRGLLRKKRAGSARRWLVYALRRDAYNSDAAIALADVQNQLEGIEDSLGTLLRETQHYKDKWKWALMALDEIRFRLSENDRAIDILEAAKERNPHNPLLWESLATFYTLRGGRGNWMIATEYYLQSEEIAPHRYERLLKWAEALFSLKQYRRAEGRINAYLAAMPGDPDGLALQEKIQRHRPAQPPPDPETDDEKSSRKFPWE